MKRLAVFLAVIAPLIGGALLLRPSPSRKTLPAVIPERPSQVRRLMVESGGRRVELRRSTDGGWSPAPGTPPQAASLLLAAEDRLLPLRAYRSLMADPADPQFGLRDPPVVVDVEDDRGARQQVALGAPSFSGGGFYARRLDGSRLLYLVARQTMSDLRSLVTGQVIKGTDSLEEKAGKLADEPTHQTPAWLQQVLDAGGRLPPGVE